MTLSWVLTDLVQSYGCDKWRTHDRRRQFVVMDSWTFLGGPIYSFLYWKIYDVRVICQDEVVGGVSSTCPASLCASSYVQYIDIFLQHWRSSECVPLACTFLTYAIFEHDFNVAPKCMRHVQESACSRNYASVSCRCVLHSDIYCVYISIGLHGVTSHTTAIVRYTAEKNPDVGNVVVYLVALP